MATNNSKYTKEEDEGRTMVETPKHSFPLLPLHLLFSLDNHYPHLVEKTMKNHLKQISSVEHISNL